MLKKIRQWDLHCKLCGQHYRRCAGIIRLFSESSWPAVIRGVPKTAIALSGWVVMGAASAECGITQSCTPLPPGILPPTTSICQVNMCFSSAESREKYERENNCIFPDSSLCGGKKVNSDTQCCVKDARTQKSKIRQKQYTALDKSFDWNVYQQECTDMQQSEAPPDGLWRQCVVGQPHAIDDNYAVMKVEPNGNARSYCIDGCSTPPSVVNLSEKIGIFIFADRNNPTGGGIGGIGELSSFLPACSNHDKCYQTCNDTNRSDCDNNMQAEMEAVCMRIPAGHLTRINGAEDAGTDTREACFKAARNMHTGLREFGSKAFSLRRQQYCQCC